MPACSLPHLPANETLNASSPDCPPLSRRCHNEAWEASHLTDAAAPCRPMPFNGLFVCLCFIPPFQKATARSPDKIAWGSPWCLCCTGSEWDWSRESCLLPKASASVLDIWMGLLTSPVCTSWMGFFSNHFHSYARRWNSREKDVRL